MARPASFERRRKLKRLLLLRQGMNNMLLLVYAMYYAVFCFHLRSMVREIKTKKQKRLDHMRWMSRLTMRCFYKNKKPTKLQRTIDAGLSQFTAKFESICDAMSAEYAAAAKDLIAEPKAAFVPDEKMQEVINELLNIDMSPSDVGRAAEVFSNDPNKVRVLFLLPSHLRKSYVLGFLPPPANP